MNCPVCSRAIEFKWKGTNLAQCPCNCIIFLTEGGDWVIAKTGLVKIPAPWLKIGSQGMADKNKFTVVGRLFVQNDDAALSFWSIVFEDGSRALLMDGYGHYAIMQKTSPEFEVTTSTLKAMKAGQIAVSKIKKHRLVRKESYFRISVEGENEWPDEGLDFDVFDFFCYDGQFTEVIKLSTGVAHILDCKFFLPSELSFMNTVTEQHTKTLVCGGCRKEHIIHAHPFTFAVSCSGCGIRYEYDVNSDKYLKAGSGDKGYVPDIEINSSGVLDGIEFKVIGYARKKETASPAEWNEYTLYNPQMGFAYLSEFEGHWVYVKEWPRPPIITAQTKDYFVENDNEFELFNDYHYLVIGAVGEHIYDLNKTSPFRVTEYIHPPQILTQEINQSEENWFYGDHIEAKKVKESFAVTSTFPGKIGVGAVEPLAFINKATLIKITLVGIVFLLLTHLIFSGTRRQEILFSDRIFFNEGMNTAEGVTPQFDLIKKESNLEITVSAPLSNNWAEFEGSFVNTATGKEYGFNKGVEFYEGNDDGGRWTEGSKRETLFITEVPAGKYYLDYKVMRDSSDSYLAQNIPNVYMQVRYDVALTRNLLWSIGFVLIIAVLQFSYFYYNDKRRWENSKYTPYNYE